MAEFELTFLGTATSLGVPMIGCHCEVCQSTDPRDNRDRASIFVRTPEVAWVVDTGPDFRRQCLRTGIDHLDAVLISHAHSDHVMGFDDLRPFTFGMEDRLPVYAAEDTMAALKHMFGFAFAPSVIQPGYLKPDPHLITGPFHLGSTLITPLPVQHGQVVTTGFRFDRPGIPSIAYVPDCKSIPPETRTKLLGIDVLILDALRYRPHSTHMNVAEALATARDLGAAKTWFTHLSHELGHAALESTLPDHIRVAYDGLKLCWG